MISRVEWDFDSHKGGNTHWLGCPDDELIYCYEYEYLRTSGITLFATPGSTEWSSSPAMQKFYEEFVTGVPPELLPNLDVKSLKPWLSLPQNDRRLKLKKVLNYEVSIPPPVRPTEVEALKRKGIYRDFNYSAWFADDDLNLITVQPMQVAWGYTTEEIVASFAEWVKEVRKATPAVLLKKGKDSAFGLRTALKELGAYRLLAEMTAKEAIGHTRGILKTGPLYQSAEGWSRAKQHAQSIISARSDESLRETLLGDFKRLEGSPDELWAVKSYLLGARREVLLRLVALSPGLVLKRAKIAQGFARFLQG